MSKLKINRIFTANMNSPYEKIEFKTVQSKIKNIDGSVALESDMLLVPAHWSDIASDVLARNYLRKRGVPKYATKVSEAGIPEWLSRSIPDERCISEEFFGAETDARQVFDRLAGTWTYWGFKGGYFDSQEDARNYFDEMRYMLAMQFGAPNSPQWFNTGLHWAYGIDGASQGHYYFDTYANALKKSTSAYERPQPHACFIQSVTDDLVNEGGIMDLWKNEARLFKYGSGTGTNFSNLRGEGEMLSGGGYSSGVMSFLRIGDVAGGSIKSGGTTRRAAKMVILNIDHPDIEKFINWKASEEEKVMDLVVGSKILRKYTKEISDNINDTANLKKAIQNALANEIPDTYIIRVLEMIRNGIQMERVEHSLDWNSPTYLNIFGRNANNSVRVTDDFLHKVEEDSDFSLTWRTDGRVCKTLKARYLWGLISKAAWLCADPGVQFDTTINAWHTCSNNGRINASNPCSEYMFLDDTACNLASLNLCKFVEKSTAPGTVAFDIEAFKHATRLWIITLEISVAMAQFPTQAIALKSYEYRTLGLGYGNLGALLMQSGIGYDSQEARSFASGITALMQGVAYETSIQMAKCLGAFVRFEENKEPMMRVMHNHFIAAYGGEEALNDRLMEAKSYDYQKNNIYYSTTAANVQKENDEYAIGFTANSPANMKTGVSSESIRYANLNIKPVPFEKAFCPVSSLADHIEEIWNKVLENGNIYGFRNAQVSVIAPTGTIGLVMDFKTTGIEPQFAQVLIKQLAGGGVWRMVNDEIEKCLEVLGYSQAEIKEINNYVIGHASLNANIRLNHDWLISKGFLENDIIKIEDSLKKSFNINQAFARYALDEELFARLGISVEKYSASEFDILEYLGATEEEIEEANKYACGHMTIEGARGIKPEHLHIFDCALPSGDGVRYLNWHSHIKMMAAIQPFISGAISKTINLPNSATIEDCSDAYMLAWKLGLKAVALFRDGSKYSGVLNVSKKKNAVSQLIDEAVIQNTATQNIIAKNNVSENNKINNNKFDEIKKNIQNDLHKSTNESIQESEMREIDMKANLFKPFRRRGYTQHVLIGGSALWHTTGEDENGKLSNLLLTYGKEGSTLRGWASAWGRILSMYLQERGDSALIRVYKAFRHSKFEPMGEVQGHPYIKRASSIPDYIVEDLVVAYPDMLNATLQASTLPPERSGRINKVKIGQETMYIIIGEDRAGRPAEIFVAGIGNEGSDLKGWMNSCAKLISLYFQDCPDTAVWQFINAFEGSSFEPAGFVEWHDKIKFATSPLDFLAKHLRMKYAHVLANEQTFLPLEQKFETINSENSEWKNDQISLNKPSSTMPNSTISCKLEKADGIEIKIRAISGYKVDEPCSSCRAFKLRYNGTCYICDNCFTTTGCS